MNKVAVVARMEDRHGVSNMDYCCESTSNIWCYFSHSQESREGNGSGITHYYPNDPLAKLLLPVPMTLCPAGLEVLVSKGGLLLPSGDTTTIPLN